MITAHTDGLMPGAAQAQLAGIVAALAELKADVSAQMQHQEQQWRRPSDVGSKLEGLAEMVQVRAWAYSQQQRKQQHCPLAASARAWRQRCRRGLCTGHLRLTRYIVQARFCARTAPGSMRLASVVTCQMR